MIDIPNNKSYWYIKWLASFFPGCITDLFCLISTTTYVPTVGGLTNAQWSHNWPLVCYFSKYFLRHASAAFCSDIMSQLNNVLGVPVPLHPQAECGDSAVWQHCSQTQNVAAGQEPPPLGKTSWGQVLMRWSVAPACSGVFVHCFFPPCVWKWECLCPNHIAEFLNWDLNLPSGDM